ncbi:MAG: hypothetical protein OQL06_12605 [Gammaproteobacteria bacterium]|nr:hypothetical protein [Gammaproteobacteria bacterium]
MSKIQEALDKIKASKNAEEFDLSKQTGLPQERIGSKADIKLSETAVFNQITHMYQPEELSPDEKDRLKIISTSMNDRKIFNAFRDLRTTISQRIEEKASPVIMVTSCTSQGGSSFVAQNLAVAVAMDESKTSLLVDCNLNAPKFSELIISENIVGLKDYLKEENRSVDEIIHPTGIPRLRVIPAGVLDIPMTEYFTNIRLRKLFEDIRERYSHRYIIVDAPPIEENADTRILAQICDYAILVVPYSKVTEKQVLTSARAIGKEKLLGTVFNNQPRTPKLSWR